MDFDGTTSTCREPILAVSTVSSSTGFEPSGWCQTFQPTHSRTTNLWKLVCTWRVMGSWETTCGTRVLETTSSCPCQSSPAFSHPGGT
ncbi:hypothetical protein DPMN_075235 [Dreissena polymorpha]|uniref:Uncharacterized protein n=1 Tax=Dreissena polymorpha TaxID=45954 RepID=A0A9D4BP74_DREPO|nr:hypothetical protein DPMN_075235 [Dreissena polymorpha]